LPRSLASYITEWNGSGDGTDIWNAFQRSGTLNNNSLAQGSELPAGALCVTVKLEPGKNASIPFALSWHFPEIEFGAGTRWRRRYTEWSPAGSGKAFEIAKQGLLQCNQWAGAH
jgi:non-lysosomal glucosylceramidase